LFDYHSKAWRRLSIYIRQKNKYICQNCGRKGVYVHHVIPINIMNENDENITLNPDNLILLCHDCHNEIHMGNKFIRQDVMFDSKGRLISKE
jgi:5-methylcytosine-specific restriction endonuclease McrA